VRLLPVLDKFVLEFSVSFLFLNNIPLTVSHIAKMKKSRIFGPSFPLGGLLKEKGAGKLFSIQTTSPSNCLSALLNFL